MTNNRKKKKIAGSRDTCNPHAEVLSAPTSPVEQVPQKLSAGIGRNPLRGSKCKTFFLIFLSLDLLVGLFFLHVFPQSFSLFLNIFLIPTQ